jgi:hypothetical protein
MIKINELPSVEFLNECFICNPSKGTLTWKIRPADHFNTDLGCKVFNSKYAGKEAGSFDSTNEYWKVGINAAVLYAHRIIYKMCYEVEPKTIDHINCNRLDNRLVNLREATPTQNSQNSRSFGNLSTGLKGSFFHKKSGKYQSMIKYNGKQIYLGLFDTPQGAHESYKRAADKYFGEFANYG